MGMCQKMKDLGRAGVECQEILSLSPANEKSKLQHTEIELNIYT